MLRRVTPQQVPARKRHGWHLTEISTWTGNANLGTGARTEVLWSNRPLSRPADDARLFEVTA